MNQEDGILTKIVGFFTGHELDEIAVVSGSGDSSHALYGSLGQPNGPRYNIPNFNSGKFQF